MIPEQYLDHTKKVSYDYFLDPGTGQLRDEWVSKHAVALPGPATKLSPGDLARIFGLVLHTELPNEIVTAFRREAITDGTLDDVTEWLGANVHQGWILWLVEGKVAFLFERTTDAINFKMAYG